MTKEAEAAAMNVVKAARALLAASEAANRVECMLARIELRAALETLDRMNP